MNNTYISLAGVSKTYTIPNGQSSISILQNLNLEMDAGDSLIITGESGSGKTTLLNLIAGLDIPDSGNISVNKIDVTALGESQLYAYRQKNIGFVFQFHHLLRDFSALENTALPALIAGKSNANDKAKALLSELGLEERMHYFPYQLSGGECQRVAIARALINEPSIILADEPTGNLDERRSREIEKLLFSVVQNKQQTIIIVTHDERLARLGSKHLHLSEGGLHER